jgi:hypothetical protein
MVLNYHFYLSDENILNISAKTKAVMADYRKDDEAARLLLISYPNLKIAKKSLTSFSKHYLADADPAGFAVIENGKIAAALLNKRLLAIVLESDSRQLAERLLKPFL